MWRRLLPLALLGLTASSTPSEAITATLATQNDWRAISGLLALVIVFLSATMLAVLRGARADGRRAIDTMLAKMERDIEAKSSLANALFSITTTLSRLQSTIDKEML